MRESPQIRGCSEYSEYSEQSTLSELSEHSESSELSERAYRNLEGFGGAVCIDYVEQMDTVTEFCKGEHVGVALRHGYGKFAAHYVVCLYRKDSGVGGDFHAVGVYSHSAAVECRGIYTGSDTVRKVYGDIKGGLELVVGGDYDSCFEDTSAKSFGIKGGIDVGCLAGL